MSEGIYNENLCKATKLIKAHEGLLRQTIRTYIQNPDDAKDVFQETILKILEYSNDGKPVKDPKAWMVRIAKNESVNFLRRMQRDANLADFICSGASGSGVSVFDEQHQAVVTQEIWNVIVEMGTIYAEVAKFRVEEYTAPETAEQLGIAEGTVKSRLRKIRKRIREYLDDEIPR